MISRNLLLLTVALLATGGFSYIYKGYDMLSTYTNGDTSSCLQSLNFNISTDYINFTESGNMANCAFSNIDLVSMFHGESLSNNQLTFAKPWANATTVSASLTADMVDQFNGSACVYLPQTNVIGVDFYMCQIQWNGLMFYTELFGQGTDLQFVMTYNQLLLPNYANNFSTANPYFTVYPGAFNLSSLVVTVSSSCGASNTTLADLNGSVVVSANYDLTSTFVNMTLHHVLIKAKDSAAGSYIAYPVMDNTILFNASSMSNSNGVYCYTFPVDWSDLLPDMSYCAEGCDMSMMLMQVGLNPVTFTNSSNNFYLMKTSGFDTGDHTSTNNNTGSGNNGSGNNNTSGGNSSNTTNSSNGGNNGNGNNNVNGGVQNNTGNGISVSGGIVLGSAICSLFMMLVSALLV